MRSFCSKDFGQIVVINFKRREFLLEGIIKTLEEKEIKNAILLGAVGSLQKVVFHRVTGFEDTPIDEFLTIEKPMEISCLQGYVANGQPHFHMVFSDLEEVYSGHLEEGTEVLYLVEVTLVEVKDLNLVRKKDDLNIAYLVEL
jgi:uncharacterized protein